MPLIPGSRRGPYEILAPLGAGGMGEVYRARDTKLNRDVALKILPDAFASDPDRLARFTHAPPGWRPELGDTDLAVQITQVLDLDGGTSVPLLA